VKAGLGDDRAGKTGRYVRLAAVVGGLAGAAVFLIAYHVVARRMDDERCDRLERRARVLSAVMEKEMRSGMETAARLAETGDRDAARLFPDLLVLTVSRGGEEVLVMGDPRFVNRPRPHIPPTRPYRWNGGSAWLARKGGWGPLLIVRYPKGMLLDDSEVLACLSFKAALSLLAEASDGAFLIAAGEEKSALYVHGKLLNGDIPEEILSRGWGTGEFGGRLYTVRDVVPGGLYLVAAMPLRDRGFPAWLGAAAMFGVFYLAVLLAQLPLKKAHRAALEERAERDALLGEELASLMEELGESDLTPSADLSALKRLRSLVSARESECRAEVRALEVLLESADGAYLVLDSERRIVRASPRFLSLVGLKELSEAKGRRFDDFLASDDDRRRFLREWSFLVQGGRVSFNAALSGSGRTVPVAVGAVPRTGGAEERVGAWLAVFDRRRAILDRQGGIVRKRLNEISMLAADIAHNFNNALCAIMGGLSLMELRIRRKGSDVLDPATEKDLETVKRAANTAASLVRQLMKLSPGSMEVKGETSVEELVELFTKRLDIRLEMDASVPSGKLLGLNKLALFRVVKEAVGSVREHGGEENSIRAVASLVNSSDVPISDSTDSVEPGKLLMLEIFASREEEMDKKSCPLDGGLKWLELQRLLVDAGGGLVENHTQRPSPNVVLYLPLLKDVVEELAEHEPFKVLVVDDQEDVARTLAEYFRFLGEEADFSLVWEEALEQVRRTRPDLVFLDMSIGHLSLGEMLDELAEAGAKKIAVSSGTPPDENRKMELAERGVTWFLQKPVTLRDIKRLMSRLIANGERPSRGEEGEEGGKE